MEFVLELGGDTDTIGAMAGGIFGARYGRFALPADLLDTGLGSLDRTLDLSRTGILNRHRLTPSRYLASRPLVR